MGVFIGVVVLLVCIGFVVLMMVSEWSDSPAAVPLAENPAAAAKSGRRASSKNAANRSSKSPGKKAPAKKKKK